MMSEDTAEDAAAAAAEQLLHLVRKLEGGANKVSGELFAFLADAVVEGPGAAIDFFAVFVSALEWAAPEMRVDVLRRLTYSIKNGGGGHRVLSELCAKGALARVLALVQQQSRSVARPVLDEALRLLHVLLSFSVSVHDIKKVLGLLTTDGDARERPAFWNALLGVLRSVQPKDGPNSFFVLSGADSGIELPPCYRFPSNGYTLLMWLRFESFGDEQQQQPVIASLQLEDFTGVQLFVQKQQLVMQSVSGTKGRVETAEFRSVSLVTRRWYFIAVAHEYRLIRKSEVTLFVDGRVAAQSTLVYPRTDANLALGCIATSAADPSFVRQRRQSLCGQLGAFVMLSEAIDPAEVASLFALGPNALSKQGDVGQEAGAMVLPKRSVKIVFAYNARAMRGKSCIETSGTGGAERHATALSGTTVANTMPLHLALHNAGGIRLLLPLFKELSTPIAQGGEDEPADRSGSGIQEMEKDPPTSQALCDLLNFVASLASRDEKYLQEMCSCKFFALLSHVFTECLPPSIWTKNAICALDELVPVCVLEPELLEQLFRQIFFNFGIWSRTSAAVQVQLVSSLMDQAKDQPEYFRKVLGVQGILDILRKYFFFSEEKGVSAATRSGDHDDVVGLRQLLLRLIGIFTKGGALTADEVRAFIVYLHDCKDDEQGNSLVQYLLALLATPGSTVADHLVKLGGVTPWLPLLRRQNSDLRMWVLKIVCQLFGQVNAQVDAATLQGWISSLRDALLDFPLRRITFFSLMELLLGKFTASCALINPLGLGKEHVIRFPAVLPLMFDLLAPAPAQLQQVCLGDLLFMLKQFSGNRAIFASFPSWPLWLLGLVSRACEEEETQKLVIETLALLIHHHLQMPELEAVGVVKDVFAIIRCQQERKAIPADNNNNFLCALGRATLQLLESDQLTYSRATESPAALSCMLQWCCITSATLFTSEVGGQEVSLSSARTRIRRRPDGLWVDIHFAQKLLDFTERLLAIANAPSAEQQPPPAGEQQTSAHPSWREVMQIMFLRLTLLLLFETHFMSHARRLEDKKEDLAKLESLARSGLGTDVCASPRPMQTLSLYLSKRMKFWSNELAFASNALGACSRRIVSSVESAVRDLRPGEARGRILLILDALQAAVRASPQPTALISLFKNVVRHSGGYFLDHSAPEAVPDSFPSDDQVALRAALTAEGRAVEAWLADFSRRGASLLQHKERTLAEGRTASERMTSRAEEMARAWAEQERWRDKVTDTRGLAHLWRQFIHNTWTSQPTHWRLDKAESSMRMRKRMKANRLFDPHRDRIAGGSSGKSPSEEVSSPSSLPASAIVRGQTKPRPAAEEEEEEEEDADEEEELPSTAAPPEGGDDSARSVFKAEIIEPMMATPGEFEFASRWIRFSPTPGRSVPGSVQGVRANEKLRALQISVQDILIVLPRRYVLQDQALEVFLQDRDAFFFVFSSAADRNKCLRLFSGLGVASISVLSRPLTPAALLRKRGATDLWVARKMSTFEYLMVLNTYAGRSFNDLAQYPVFPWVIADYTSETLDLENPQTFRDLSKPMGALFPAKRAEVVERFQAFDDPDIPRFHHGTFYSTIGSVLHYLVRMEPFTTYFLELQGGRFDHVNRMFLALQASFSGAALDAGCTKELTPEFFSTPEFLLNVNRFNFGLPVGNPAPVDDEGLVASGVGDVVLPPWAQTAEDFIRINREALESEFVSEHINEWIDLIFGFKSRGEEAEKAVNVFYYLVYENAVDISVLQDEHQKQALLSQILNFGSAPAQLFTRPHPKRSPLSSDSSGKPPASIVLLHSGAFRTPVSVISVRQKDVVTISEDGVVGAHSFGGPLDFVADRNSITSPQAQSPARSASMRGTLRSSGSSFASAPASLIAHQSVEFPCAEGLGVAATVAVNHESRLLFVGGQWDGKISVRNLSGKLVRSVPVATDIVTCVAFDRGFLAAGSRDCTVAVFNLSAAAGKKGRASKDPLQRPAHTVYGHSGAICAVAVCEDFDVLAVASCGNAPLLTLHTLRDGTFLRRVEGADLPADQAVFGPLGHLVLFCSRTGVLSVFSLNADLIAQTRLDLASPNIPIAISPDGKLVAVAGASSTIVVLRFHDLKQASPKLAAGSSVTALAFSSDCKWLFCALEDASFVAFSM